MANINPNYDVVNAIEEAIRCDGKMRPKERAVNDFRNYNTRRTNWSFFGESQPILVQLQFELP